MAPNPQQELIGDIGHDLRKLAEIISNFQLSTSGDREVYRASGDLQRRVGGTDVLSIQLANIDLQIDDKQRFKPAGVELEGRLVADVVLQQDLDLAANGAALDSIRENKVTFTIGGTSVHRGTTNQVIAAWHFDRHSYNQATNACHPTYHWQFGGWGLKEVSDSIEGVLVMDTPRLFAPPMDAVLAIDFLLSHFNGPAWQGIRSQTPGYLDIVRRSQNRLWKPFFTELAAQIASSGTSPSNHFGRLLPNIV